MSTPAQPADQRAVIGTEARLGRAPLAAPAVAETEEEVVEPQAEPERRPQPVQLGFGPGRVQRRDGALRRRVSPGVEIGPDDDGLAVVERGDERPRLSIAQAAREDPE